MNKLPVVVELFYDVVSPYSFLAFEALCRYKKIWKIDLQLKPVSLIEVGQTAGNTPPALVSNKEIYMAKDLRRLQKFFQIPLFVPRNIMDLILTSASVDAQKFIAAIDVLEPNCVEDISRALYRRVFETHKDITKPESWREAAESIGMDKTLIERAFQSLSDQKASDRFKQYNKLAIDYKAFGLPTMVAHIDGKPQMFFGADRLELLAFTLGEKWSGPVPS